MKGSENSIAISFRITGLILAGALVGGCATSPVGRQVARGGDEIVAAGQFFHTGTRVVLWMDPGGYDAYRVQRRFSPIAESGWKASHAENTNLYAPNRYDLRAATLTPEQIETVRGGGWDLPLLRQVVDQLVFHFDASGTSRECFKTLQDDAGLSVHFMLDVDGTIYQTLDLKERAWHATTSNNRSVGVEIANLGAYDANGKNPFNEWYKKTANGQTVMVLPARFGDGGIRTPGFAGHPARPEPVRGNIQGQDLIQYDYTPQQYRALIRLTAALCKIFPQITCDYPRDASGRLLTRKLPDEQLKQYQGILGHYHIQTDKVDPGPAFQWDLVVQGARRRLSVQFPAKGATLLRGAPARVARAEAGHDFDQWEKEITAFEQADRTNPPPSGAVLFIGSSGIRNWTTLARDFPDQPVINRGFGGSEIADATHFAGRIVFPYHPRMVFLRAGDNDLWHGKSPEAVFADFKQFVARIHARLPRTEIVFISANPSPARWRQADREKALDDLVETWSRQIPGVKCIPAYDLVLDAAGRPRPELFVADQLHFNADGYQLLAERVRPYLSK